MGALVSPPCESMCAMRRANALTGQVMLFWIALWCIVSPMRPFFWLLILRVQESACKRVANGLVRESCLPFLKKPTSPTRKLTVRFLLFLGTDLAGL